MPSPVALVGNSVQLNAPIYAGVSPMGELRVSQPAVQLFVDTFDTGTLDPIRWGTATNGGTGVVPTASVGSAVLNGGTTLNSFSKLASAPTFAPTQPGYLQQLTTANIPVPRPGAGHIFIGRGTSSATPTIAAPLIQAFGFEYFTDGKLYAVSYMTGTRFVVADLSGFQNQFLADGAAHKFLTYFRGDSAFYCIDSADNPVAQFQTGASGPDVNALPLLYQVISNGAAALTLQLNGITLGDTAHNTFWLADGTYGFRKASVDGGGAFGVQLGGTQTAVVAAAGSANVKASPGRLGRVVITAAGTASLTFYDNAAGGATGTVIGVTPATTSVGQVFDFSMPALVGISAVGGAGSPGATIGFS